MAKFGKDGMPEPYQRISTPTHTGIAFGSHISDGFVLVPRQPHKPTPPDPPPPKGYYIRNGGWAPIPPDPPAPTPKPSNTLYAWVRRTDGTGVDAFIRVNSVWTKQETADSRWINAPTFSGDYLPG